MRAFDRHRFRDQLLTESKELDNYLADCLQLPNPDETFTTEEWFTDMMRDLQLIFSDNSTVHPRLKLKATKHQINRQFTIYLLLLGEVPVCQQIQKIIYPFVRSGCQYDKTIRLERRGQEYFRSHPLFAKASTQEKEEFKRMGSEYIRFCLQSVVVWAQWLPTDLHDQRKPSVFARTYQLLKNQILFPKQSDFIIYNRKSIQQMEQKIKDIAEEVNGPESSYVSGTGQSEMLSHGQSEMSKRRKGLERKHKMSVQDGVLQKSMDLQLKSNAQKSNLGSKRDILHEVVVGVTSPAYHTPNKSTQSQLGAQQMLIKQKEELEEKLKKTQKMLEQSRREVVEFRKRYENIQNRYDQQETRYNELLRTKSVLLKQRNQLKTMNSALQKANSNNHIPASPSTPKQTSALMMREISNVEPPNIRIHGTSSNIESEEIWRGKYEAEHEQLSRYKADYCNMKDEIEFLKSEIKRVKQSLEKSEYTNIDLRNQLAERNKSFEIEVQRLKMTANSPQLAKSGASNNADSANLDVTRLSKQVKRLKKLNQELRVNLLSDCCVQSFEFHETQLKRSKADKIKFQASTVQQLYEPYFSTLSEEEKVRFRKSLLKSKELLLKDQHIQLGCVSEPLEKDRTRFKLFITNISKHDITELELTATCKQGITVENTEKIASQLYPNQQERVNFEFRVTGSEFTVPLLVIKYNHNRSRHRKSLVFPVGKCKFLIFDSSVMDLRYDKTLERTMELDTKLMGSLSKLKDYYKGLQERVDGSGSKEFSIGIRYLNEPYHLRFTQLNRFIRLTIKCSADSQDEAAKILQEYAFIFGAVE